MNLINFISYRITKYNPQNRNDLGFYQVNEWTSLSDIDTTYNSKKFTMEEYVKAEDAYIETIIFFMHFLKLNYLYVTYLEKHYSLPKARAVPCTKSMLEIYKKISGHKQVNEQEVCDIARLALRELLWCKLTDKDMFVHFGYDYYMFIGSSKKTPKPLIEKIESLGLFVEEFESPYLPDTEDEN